MIAIYQNRYKEKSHDDVVTLDEIIVKIRLFQKILL